MVEQDTIKLIRECDAGVKMGISSIEDVIGKVKAKELYTLLKKCMDEHKRLLSKIQSALERFKDDGKDPNPMAKGMSYIKTAVKIAADYSDETIADLMTDGCNMGVKSLSRYLNQYKAADEESKDIAKKLIKLEEQLAIDIRDYL